jgi:hypothetical protein
VPTAALICGRGCDCCLEGLFSVVFFFLVLSCVCFIPHLVRTMITILMSLLLLVFSRAHRAWLGVAPATSAARCYTVKRGALRIWNQGTAMLQRRRLATVCVCCK